MYSDAIIEEVVWLVGLWVFWTSRSLYYFY